MANGQIKLHILDIVGSPIWVATKDGQKVHDKIAAAFDKGRSVILSFANCRMMIPAFLNAAIGQLYDGRYEDEFIKEHLVYTDVSSENQEEIDFAIANTKRYLANPSGYDRAWKEVMDEDY